MPAVVPNGTVPGRTGGFPRRSPLRTVRATHRGTRLMQAARAWLVEALVSCAGGRGARGGRRRVRGGAGHRPVIRGPQIGGGSRQISPRSEERPAGKER